MYTEKIIFFKKKKEQMLQFVCSFFLIQLWKQLTSS